MSKEVLYESFSPALIHALLWRIGVSESTTEWRFDAVRAHYPTFKASYPKSDYSESVAYQTFHCAFVSYIDCEGGNS